MWLPASIKVAMAICSAACPLEVAERARALLQRGHPLLEHRDGGIGDAAVDVAADFEVEQAGGVIDVAEDERGRLVDRHRPRAGDGIGMLAGVQRQRVGLQELGVDHEALTS